MTTRKPKLHLNMLPLTLHQVRRLQEGHGVFVKYEMFETEGSRQGGSVKYSPVALTSAQERKLLHGLEEQKDFFLKQTPDQLNFASAYDREKLETNLWQFKAQHSGYVRSSQKSGLPVKGGGGIIQDGASSIRSSLHSGLIMPAENLAKAYIKAQSAKLTGSPAPWIPTHVSKSVLDTAIKKLTGGAIDGQGLYLPQGRGLYLA